MKEYKEAMIKELNKIKKLLKEKNNTISSKDLILDKEILLYQIYGKQFSEEYESINDNLKENDIKKTILTNKIKKIPIKPIYGINKKNNSFQIVDKFLEEDTFDLKEFYKIIKNENTLFYTKDIPKLSGCTIYLNSIKKNYVLINKNNTNYDGAILIHELGHVKQNLLSRKFVNKKLTSNFDETYSYFLTLVYFNYLKKIGFDKDSFNYKYNFLDKLLLEIDGLSEMVICEEINSKRFKYEYKLIISELLAIYFYNLYLFDDKKCIQLINEFNKNYENVSDYDLLKSINLDFSIFENKNILNTFINLLKEEKSKIKKI